MNPLYLTDISRTLLNSSQPYNLSKTKTNINWDKPGYVINKVKTYYIQDKEGHTINPYGI